MRQKQLCGGCQLRGGDKRPDGGSGWHESVNSVEKLCLIFQTGA
jgi:hypothetical protein